MEIEMQNQPFHRAMAMMQAIASAMSMPTHLQQAAMNKIGTYQSRGKGRGAPSPRFIKKAGKYSPHYGAKESAKFVARHAEV